MVASDPRADVVSVFEDLFAALLQRRDASAAARLFVNDCDPVMWGSDEAERATGHTPIAELHRGIARFAGDLAFQWHERHVHLKGDVAWINAAGELVVTPAGQPPHTSPYRLTAVFVWRDGSWRWHTFNGSEPNPG